MALVAAAARGFNAERDNVWQLLERAPLSCTDQIRPQQRRQRDLKAFFHPWPGIHRSCGGCHAARTVAGSAEIGSTRRLDIELIARTRFALTGSAD
jgi:hypothetical protein